MVVRIEEMEKVPTNVSGITNLDISANNISNLTGIQEFCKFVLECSIINYRV
jgi:hypothetical protein